MYLFFDTETNGLPNNWSAPVTALSNWPRLVQIAWVLFDNKGNEIDSNQHIIKPEGFTIPQQAVKVHGITTEKANKEGIDILHSLETFNDQIAKATHLVAHNINFDEMIVGAEFLRAGHENPIPHKKRLCTMKNKRIINFCALPGKYGFKWPSLSELHIKLFGIDFEGAHDAAADINATARCFWELKKKGVI